MNSIPVNRYFMKTIIVVLLLAVVIAGCSKTEGVKPISSTSTTTTGNNSKTPTGTTVALSHDDSIHLAKFAVSPQTVNTSVSGTNLILEFNENVNLLFTAEAYQKTSAVHLFENFKNTLLAGFDYTTVAEGGNTTLNWVDDNLNNVILKTVTDTIVGSVDMVKINVHRQFTFFKIYPSNQLALNEQKLFANKKDDTVSFSSYCYYNQKNYPSTSSSAQLEYLR
jgi:hypothetical protein